VIIICESESDLEFFADCEDSDIDDDDDGVSDEELTVAVSRVSTYVHVHRFTWVLIIWPYFVQLLQVQ